LQPITCGKAMSALEVLRYCALAKSWPQRRPTFEINEFTTVFVQYRTVVLSIIDIKTHVDYIPFHRRLHFAFALSGKAYRFEVTIVDG
jgi:hypothetical protein